MGKTIDDMPPDDELEELVDIQNMRRAGAWKKALTRPSFWAGVLLRLLSPIYPIVMIVAGIRNFNQVCAVNLGGFLIGDGLMLLCIVAWGIAFEISIRMLQWEKSSFIFCPGVIMLGVVHLFLYVNSFGLLEAAQPGLDFTWTLTSWDERHAGEEGSPREKILVEWGVPTPSPTAAGTFDGIGCQLEVLDMFRVFQVVSGGLGIFWVVVLGKMVFYLPKFADDEDGVDDAMVEKIKAGEIGGPAKLDLGLELEGGEDGDGDGDGDAIAIKVGKEGGGGEELAQITVEPARGEGTFLAKVEEEETVEKS